MRKYCKATSTLLDNQEKILQAHQNKKAQTDLRRRNLVDPQALNEHEKKANEARQDQKTEALQAEQDPNQLRQAQRTQLNQVELKQLKPSRLGSVNPTSTDVTDASENKWKKPVIWALVGVGTVLLFAIGGWLMFTIFFATR